MKKSILTLLSSLALTAAALAHGEVEIGPNGGRILEFSKDATTLAEVTVKDGKFHIAVLDKNMKPAKVSQQTLTATGGTREKSEKLAVEKTDKGFVVPVVGENQWLILQFRETPGAKPFTARLQYETKPCGECKKPEWLCACGAKKK